jgi:chromosome segregation ATPase
MEFTTPEEQLAHVGEQAQSVEDHGEAALGEVERALSEKEAELAKLASALDERLALADAQKAEIVAGGEQAKSVEDHGDAAVGEVERALSEKEAELAKLTNALDERSALADAQKAEIVAGVEQAKSMEDRGDAAVGEVWRALSKRGTERVKLTNALDECSALADAQKAEIAALMTQTETLKERLAEGGNEAIAVDDHRDAAVRDAERALSEKEAELVKLRSALDERSALADAQKADIVALTTLIATLKERLAQGGNEARLVDDQGAAVRDAEGALSEKEAELIKLRSALDERSALADAQKAEIVALTTQIKTLKERLAQGGNEVTAVDDQGDATVRDAERALSEKEAELVKLRSALDECSVTADLQKTEIVVLKVQVQTLQARLSRAGEEAKELQDRYNAAERALTEKEAELDKLRSTHDEGSVAAESHKAEIVALSRQIGTLKKQLIRVTEEARAEREQRDAASIELKSVTQKLNEFVRQTADERAIGRRAQQELESRLAEQSQLLNESEFELDYLRSEAESTRQAEADLRIAIIEIDSRAHAAAQDFKVEKARLQAALERANGERARLTYELAEMKRRAEDNRAAERVENVMLSGAP